MFLLLTPSQSFTTTDATCIWCNLSPSIENSTSSSFANLLAMIFRQSSFAISFSKR